MTKIFLQFTLEEIHHRNIVVCEALTLPYFYNTENTLVAEQLFLSQLIVECFDFSLYDCCKKKKEKTYKDSRPQLMCDYPLNLSILIRGGKETNWDSLSSGERNGISSSRRIMGLIVH